MLSLARQVSIGHTRVLRKRFVRFSGHVDAAFEELVARRCFPIILSGLTAIAVRRGQEPGVKREVAEDNINHFATLLLRQQKLVDPPRKPRPFINKPGIHLHQVRPRV